MPKDIEARWKRSWEEIANTGSKALAEIEEFLKICKTNKKICLFGLGVEGLALLHALQKSHLSVRCVCDNNPKLWETSLEGIPCHSPKMLFLQPDDWVVVMATRYYAEIEAQLRQAGIQHIYVIPSHLLLQKECLEREYLQKNRSLCDTIFCALQDEESKLVYTKRLELFAFGATRNYYSREFWAEIARPEEDTYFYTNFFALTHNEVFVDGGAFDGDSLLLFIKHCNGSFKKAICFEPDEKNFRALKSTIEKLPLEQQNNIEIVKKGLYVKPAEFSVQSSGVSSTLSVPNNLGQNIQVINLDAAIQDAVSFIKMDIEGSEYFALQGAKQTITKNAPILAISLYHKIEDIWDLPLLILKLNPEYRLYMRHYNVAFSETVCFAVPPERVLNEK